LVYTITQVMLSIYVFVYLYYRNILQELQEGVETQCTEDTNFSLNTHTFGPTVVSSVLNWVTGAIKESLPAEEEEN